MTRNKDIQSSENWPDAGDYRRSIRIDFSIYVSAMVLVLMVTAGFVITDKYVDTVTLGVVDKLLVQARAFSGTAGKHLISSGTPDALLLNNICKKLASDNPDVFWCGIADNADVLVAHTDIRQVMAGKQLMQVEAGDFHSMLQRDEALTLTSDTLFLSIPIEENGVRLGRLGVASATRQISSARSDSIIAVGSTTAAIILIGLPLTMIGLHRKLRPVTIITDRLKSASYEDFNLDIPVVSRNEFGYLAETLRVAGNRLRKAQDERLEHERVSRELEIAREIQARILPHEYPTGHTFACAGNYQSAREVGGDYYDFIRFSDTKLGFLVADVSGKSLPGMLVMLMTRDIVRQVARFNTSPAQVLQMVNRELRSNIKPGMFVTMFFATLDTLTGVLTFASAGHNPLVHISDRGTRLIKTKGYPLGMMPPEQFDSRIEETSLALATGDWFVQYTDGINEAQNSDREEFGMDRFVDALEKHRQMGPERLIEGVLKHHSHFVSNAQQYDDITLIAVKWIGTTTDTTNSGQKVAQYAD